MTRRQRILLTLVVAISCVGCDQAVKTIAEQTLSVSDPIRLLGDVFHLQYSENQGAMLGIGSDFSKETRFWLFIVFTGAALLAILAFTIVSRNLSTIEVFSLSLVLGGGLSNLIDRVTRGGIVVDFVMIVIGSLRTAIFNLADIAIILGLCLLVIANLPWLSRSAKEPQ